MSERIWQVREINSIHLTTNGNIRRRTKPRAHRQEVALESPLRGVHSQHPLLSGEEITSAELQSGTRLLFKHLLTLIVCLHRCLLSVPVSICRRRSITRIARLGSCNLDESPYRDEVYDFQKM